MTNEQILKKAVEKAVKNGWGKYAIEQCDEMWLSEMMEEDSYYSVIFSHDFVKAFWGKQPTCSCGYKIDKGGHPCTGHKELWAWEFHLQQMVLEKDPIKYLEKFL